ncbi:response regulator transcription factor [Granulicella sp. dw_53]|uniref:response regulator n=1 Tax=Granulicella sp. dw_53 TaxID=2719792 RepID=UPI001BD42F0C|nr:response regulator transcription factor [Granulicella sp. dw_53]
MSQPSVIRVLCVDDHPLVRDGIKFAVQAQSDMTLVAEASNGLQAIEQFNLHSPDVTLMDLKMPVMGGVEAIIAIREIHPLARFIVLTTYSGDVQAARALKAGASGYLLKGSMGIDLLQAIRDVHAGRRRIPAQVASEIAEHVDSDTLSPREIEVLRSVATGSSNRSIASILRISEETVKGHMKNILSKLSANDRTHAVTIALKRGFLDS